MFKMRKLHFEEAVPNNERFIGLFQHDKKNSC